MTIILIVFAILIVKDSPAKSKEQKNSQIVKSDNLYKIDYVRIIMLGVILGMQYAALMGIQGLWGSKILTDVLRYSEIQSSNTLIFIGVGLMIGGIITGSIIDKYPERRQQIWIIEIASVVFLWIIFILKVNVLSNNCIKLIYFSIGLLNGTYVCPNAELRCELPSKYFGKAIGIVNGIPFIIIAIFQPFMSYLIQLGPNFGVIYSLQAYRNGLFLCLFSALSSLIMAIFFFRKNVFSNH